MTAKPTSTDRPWTEASIMDRVGLAQGRIGTTHNLTPDVQGKYHYTIGPYSDPVMKIKPGDRVVFSTPDCFEGRIQAESDKPSQILEMPYINPQCGPVLVEGTEKGDALAVYVESMEPRGENPRGTCCLIPEFGA